MWTPVVPSLAAHVLLELVPFSPMTLAKDAGVGLHLTPELVDVLVETLPSGLSAHAD